MVMNSYSFNFTDKQQQVIKTGQKPQKETETSFTKDDKCYDIYITNCILNHIPIPNFRADSPNIRRDREYLSGKCGW